MSENSNGYDYLIKLLALGDSGVGKTVRNSFLQFAQLHSHYFSFLKAFDKRFSVSQCFFDTLRHSQNDYCYAPSLYIYCNRCSLNGILS